MKPPICKLCGSPHWLDEGHKPTAALEEVRKLGAEVLRNQTPTVTKRNNVTPVTEREREPSLRPKRLDSSGRGRPRVHKTNAERQRAYRERSR